MQVGLVAVQLIGEEIAGKENDKNSANPSQNEISQFDDLAFEMYVDSEVTELLKQLDEKKKKAVQGIHVRIYLKLMHSIVQQTSIVLLGTE